MRRIALPITVLALLAAACSSGGAVVVSNVRDTAPSAKSSTHFAGFPQEGAHPSLPATGTLVLSMDLPSAVWHVYADGRMIWQKWSHAGDPLVIPKGASALDTTFVEQRLTPQGVRLLRSRMLATGLLAHNLTLGRPAFEERGTAADYTVLRGSHEIDVQVLPPSYIEHPTNETPAQARTLARLDALIGGPFRWLPASAWADREMRAYVPSHYHIGFDRGAPEISKLPSPAGEVLRQFKPLFRHACQVITTDQARAILEAFSEAGVASNDHASGVAFDFSGLGFSHPSYLFMGPALPEDHC
jgi:hypothetical protein